VVGSLSSEVGGVNVTGLFTRAGVVVRVDTFKDLTQSAQRKSGDKSEKDRGVNRREAECAEKTEERRIVG
jgi:hypothetical protein